MKIKIVIALSALLGIYLFLGYVFPIMLVGRPLPLFEIRNEDDKTHTVRVLVFDGNRVVLNETFVIKPKGSIRYERGFGWYPRPTFELITWASGSYRFVVSTENVKLERTFRVHPWTTVIFEIANGNLSCLVVTV